MRSLGILNPLFVVASALCMWEGANDIWQGTPATQSGMFITGVLGMVTIIVRSIIRFLFNRISNTITCRREDKARKIREKEEREAQKIREKEEREAQKIREKEEREAAKQREERENLPGAWLDLYRNLPSYYVAKFEAIKQFCLNPNIQKPPYPQRV